jgi:hypothetical protein
VVSGIINKKKYKADSDPEKRPSEPKKIKAMSGVGRPLAERIGQCRIYEIKSEDKEI